MLFFITSFRKQLVWLLEILVKTCDGASFLMSSQIQLGALNLQSKYFLFYSKKYVYKFGFSNVIDNHYMQNFNIETTRIQ